MKYIIVKNQFENENAIVFCDNIIHKHVSRIHCVSDERVVSAGFFVLDQNNVATAYGRSDSLDMESRPEDSEIISKMFLTD
jgi:hypothetical protein